MKITPLILLILALNVSAITLDTVIATALTNNPSLEVINARLQANKEDITLTKQFTNPRLTLSSNSIDASEPMSQTILNFSQKIEYYNKRESKEKVALQEEKVLQEKLHFAKVALVAKIKEAAYTLWELQAQKKIIEEYVRLTKKNIELFESYASVSSNQHMGIMKAELSLADLGIKNSLLDAKIYTAYSRLSYLASSEISHLDIELFMQEEPSFELLKQKLLNNPSLILKDKKIKKQDAKIKLAEINSYPDFNLLAGYAYREKFDNYFNFGVSLSLPIYATEERLIQKQKIKKQALREEKRELHNSLESMLKTYYARLLSSYKVYHIVQDEALPQVAHMFELSESSVATGGDLFKYIDVLFSKLKLEQQSISAVATYKKNQAKISFLAGELK